MKERVETQKEIKKTKKIKKVKEGTENTEEKKRETNTKSRLCNVANHCSVLLTVTRDSDTALLQIQCHGK